MHNSSLASVVILAAVAGCSASQPRMTGDSVASAKLRKDTLALVEVYALGVTGCQRVDSVETSVVSVSDVIAGNRAGAMTAGTVQERWVALACGRSVSLLVTFTPDGSGGSFISVEGEK